MAFRILQNTEISVLYHGCVSSCFNVLLPFHFLSAFDISACHLRRDLAHAQGFLSRFI
ncbi:hypothetical protein BDQ12DRAFT_679270 [Crucibulum laeve]|uniref:Uncharacterized protein n=1 Tax=Crucibulum laeve TaxID=68775 RepID=A0A5C3MA35_9AGAR|nr:hypothetical protein BDQ12DRAFT_679270 [Crucibulum laeve]